MLTRFCKGERNWERSREIGSWNLEERRGFGDETEVLKGLHQGLEQRDRNRDRERERERIVL